MWSSTYCGSFIFQRIVGSGFPSKNDFSRPNDLPGCENGASWDAPLMVANDKIPPPYIWVHPATWKIKYQNKLF
jgi:hypothetical protein